MDHTITVVINDNGNVRLQRPSSIDNHRAAAGLRRAAEVIDHWTAVDNSDTDHDDRGNPL